MFKERFLRRVQVPGTLHFYTLISGCTKSDILHDSPIDLYGFLSTTHIRLRSPAISIMLIEVSTEFLFQQVSWLRYLSISFVTQSMRAVVCSRVGAFVLLSLDSLA